MNDEVLELFHTRLMTLELIVSGLHETLIDRGLINKDEFNSSLDDKIKKVKEIAKIIEEDSSEIETIIPNIFGGPIGEA